MSRACARARALRRVARPSASASTGSTGRPRSAAIGTTVSMQRTNGLDSTRSKVASCKQVDEQAGLAMTATRERSQAIVVDPGVAVSGLGVADQIDGHPRDPSEARELAVGFVGEKCRGIGRRNPTPLVDLVVRVPRRTSSDDRHVPEPHLFVAPLPVYIADRRQLVTQRATVSGLLLDLADGRVLVGLARLDLALGQAPVVVARAGARPAPRRPDPGRVAGDDTARGPDELALGSHPGPQAVRAAPRPTRRRTRPAARTAKPRSISASMPERVRLRGAALRRGLAEPPVGDDRVLVLAEHVLHARERVREVLRRRVPITGLASSEA